MSFSKARLGGTACRRHACCSQCQINIRLKQAVYSVLDQARHLSESKLLRKRPSRVPSLAWPVRSARRLIPADSKQHEQRRRKSCDLACPLTCGKAFDDIYVFSCGQARVEDEFFDGYVLEGRSDIPENVGLSRTPQIQGMNLRHPQTHIANESAERPAAMPMDHTSSLADL